MSDILSVLAPIDITDARFYSSTAPENDYAAYVAGTTYGTDQLCISTTTHRIYRSLRSSNMGNDPTNILNRTGVTPWWQDLGPTNKWNMVDGEGSTQTAIASPLTVVLRPGVFDSIYLGNLDAEAMTIVVKDAPGGTVIFSLTSALEGSAPGDYDEYFFDPFLPQTDFLVSGIQQYSAAETTVTLTRGSGLVKCGMLAFGALRKLGRTQSGATAEPKSYSYIKIDDFGNNTIVRRKKAKDMSATATLALSEANSVLAAVTDLLDVPCVWVCSDLTAYTGLRTFGLGSATIAYNGQLNCQLNLKVQGLI